MLILIIIFGIILDRQIRNRINGKIWQLPNLVYSRIIDINSKSLSYNKPKIIKILLSRRYRPVTKISRTGEFIVNNNSIEILRRPFKFPNSLNSKNFFPLHLCLFFKKGILNKIVNLYNGQKLSSFRLDPLLLTIWPLNNREQRLFTPIDQFPDMLISILLATEDREFYNHDGISISAICRAFLANLIAGRTIQGGSTITQQLVRNLFLNNERSLWRKIKEVYMAVIMNARYSKKHILEIYLNEIFLGHKQNEQIRGFPLASLYYFGRPITELGFKEQVLLVAMIKGASIYNPYYHPRLTFKRRNIVLSMLYRNKIINLHQYIILKKSSLGIQPLTPDKKDKYPAFMQKMIIDLYHQKNLNINNISGMKIFSTLDPMIDNAAKKSITQVIPFLQKKHGLQDLEGAIVIIDRITGEIRSIIGGSHPQFAGYNRALQARRSIGSLVKPVIFLSALNQPTLYNLNTKLNDIPLELQLSKNHFWKPRNNDYRFGGSVTLLDTLTYSINLPTVNLGVSLGIRTINENLVKLGISKNHLSILPSLLLGALNLTPFEVTKIYQTIASGGYQAPLSTIRYIVDSEDHVIYNSIAKIQKVFPTQATYLTLYTMQQVVSHGTAYKLGFIYPDYQLAAKTGTTNRLHDSWLAGINGKEVVVIWIGRDNNESTKLYGSNGALNLYKIYLKHSVPTPFLLSKPKEISMININRQGDLICNTASNFRTIPIWNIKHEKFCNK
ncbi:MAG: penicillin-binding protein 1B [Candidatus Dasytiphilus stammeri]